MSAIATTDRPDIDFDTELQHGPRTYDLRVGDWWLDQSDDEAHRLAYHNIAEHIRARLPKPPQTIVDYACGAGSLLLNLCERFPEAKVIGIDGSAKMIEKANERLAAVRPEWADRVEFWESDLPNFQLPDFQADLVVFCFPNICPKPDDQPYYDEHGGLHRADRRAARWLSKAREKNPDHETCKAKPSALFTALMDCKVVTRNLRGLIHDRGFCARVEYATGKWRELSRLVRMRQAFEQGFLDEEVDGKKPEALFKLKKTDYFPSEVIKDVYHQTGDEGDREGGFQINMLKAL
jgi:SAM-dependent methyltransferase